MTAAHITTIAATLAASIIVCSITLMLRPARSDVSHQCGPVRLALLHAVSLRPSLAQTDVNQ